MDVHEATLDDLLRRDVQFRTSANNLESMSTVDTISHAASLTQACSGVGKGTCRSALL